MRVWDVDVKRLCSRHLLAQHVEIHTIWSVITRGLRGYANHPEVVRWRPCTEALYVRHEATVKEMLRRGFNHKSPLDRTLGAGPATQKVLLVSREEQLDLLRSKPCPCPLELPGEDANVES